MFQAGGYVFKRAETSEELEQIHRLNYRTFVAEIPQHHDCGSGLLVDKFHVKNCYLIALENKRVIGMVSVHDQPPFSVADRLSDPSILQLHGSKPLEVRLLAVEPAKRSGPVMMGLLVSVYEYSCTHGYTHLYISGLSDRMALYRQLGFEPLGPAVRCGEAEFVPMMVTLSTIAARKQRTLQMWQKHLERIASRNVEPLCLLPGPVAIPPAVHEAFRKQPIYHRGGEFISLYEKVRRSLGEMVGGRDVAILNGSGTLGNEVVAATLAADPAQEASVGRGLRGVMLVNGEFGQRLARQATRFGLNPRVLSWSWGQPWNLDEVDAALKSEPRGSWVWGVHQESSTGVLNDLAGLVRIAERRGVRVCADCISSLGAAPLDLTGVFLATGASGKSLGSYAGASIIFADAGTLRGSNMDRVPSYLDLPAALATRGPRFTFPSPILLALDAALSEYATPHRAQVRYSHYAELGMFVREQLRQLGIEPIADESCAAPVITTFAPVRDETSETFVSRCREWGFAIGGHSGYLAERRLVQIATMGNISRDDCVPLFDRLQSWLLPTGKPHRREESAKAFAL
jgi:aspartate aminotransferase-like enzyme/N-acyl-L-homoserine lactone synthetase